MPTLPAFPRRSRGLALVLATVITAPAVPAQGSRTATSTATRRAPTRAPRTARPTTAPSPTRSTAAPAVPSPGPSAATAPTTPATAPGGVAADPAAAAVVAGIQGFYNRTQDWQADFTQESRNRLTGQTQTRAGHVVFRKPGRMRWTYANPTGDLIVSDGVTLWTYEAAARQALQTTLSQSQLPSALSFLTGTGDLAADFHVRLMPPAEGYSGHLLELTPRSPNPAVSRIVFYVDRTTFQIARVALLDAQNNSNRFDFRTPQVNLSPPDSLFRWSPPAGTNVVRP